MEDELRDCGRIRRFFTSCGIRDAIQEIQQSVPNLLPNYCFRGFTESLLASVSSLFLAYYTGIVWEALRYRRRGTTGDLYDIMIFAENGSAKPTDETLSFRISFLLFSCSRNGEHSSGHCSLSTNLHHVFVIKWRFCLWNVTLFPGNHLFDSLRFDLSIEKNRTWLVVYRWHHYRIIFGFVFQCYILRR